MKIIAFVFTFFIVSNIFVFSQETESIAASEVVASSEVPVEDVAEAVATTAEIAENPATVDSSIQKIDYLAEDYEFEFIEIPAAKRPKPISEEKITEAKNKDETETSFDETVEVIKYGTSSEITSIIDDVLKSEDPRYADSFYDLFQNTKNIDIRCKILDFFAKAEDPCLEDFCVDVLNDPYDLPLKVIESVFKYVSAVKCKLVAPAVVEILELGKDEYFLGAITTLGDVGGPSEALYLAEYLERDDMTLPQRQALMRTLGQMCAIETWDKLVEIVNDEEENSFVRMYAAEALGKMKKEEAVPILVKLFEEGDPNMRQYCVKGLSNFSNNDEAKAVILQGIRDEHYKVRVESIKTVAELNITEAVPFLTYRATKDAEMVVKKECFPVLAKLDTEESVDFLIKQITDEKVGDNAKLMASSALMEKGTKGEKEIINLAKETLKDDKRKKLRSELGKLFAKYARPAYSEICASYLQSKDTTTISQGIDIYKNGRYETARVTIEKIARDKKTGANGKRARKILGISDEEVETKDDSTSEKSTDKKNTDDKSNKLQTKSDSSKTEAKPTDVNKKSELDAK